MDSDHEDNNIGPLAPPSREATAHEKTPEVSESGSSVTVSAIVEPNTQSGEVAESDVQAEAKTSLEAGKRKHASTPEAPEVEHDRAKELVQARHNANNSTRASSIASSGTRTATQGASSTTGATGALQYKPKSQIIFQSNGQAPEMIFSRQDVNQVNFYAAHPINSGDRFIAVIEPTDEGLNSLIQTIRDEVGASDGKKRVVVSFATVKDSYAPHLAADILNVGHARRQSTQSQGSLASSTYPASEAHTSQTTARQPQARSNLTYSVLPSFGPRHPAPQRLGLPILPANQPRQVGAGGSHFGPFHGHRHSLGANTIPGNVRSRLGGPSRSASVSSSVEFVRTVPAPDTPLPFNRPAGTEGDSDDVIITRVEPRLRPFATPQAIGPHTLRPASLLSSPGSDAMTPGSSDRFNLARLQLQWPYPYPLGGRLSAIGTFVIIYRNILRHLHNPNVGSLEENVYSLRSLFTDKELRMWNYLWAQMDTPDSQSKRALREETTELVDDIAWLLGIHGRDEFTFERLASDDGLLRALWTIEPLRFYQKSYMYQYPITADCWSGWELLPVDQDLLDRPARIEWDGTGRIDDKFRELFDVKHERDGSTPSKVKYCCAMPAVIEVHLTAAPAGVRPGKRILEALGDFYLWDWDTSAAVGDGEFAASDSTPKVEGMYQLMGVVRLRKDEDPEDRDHVRIYTWGKKCVVPETKTCFYPSEWTLAEPGRQFRLYYVKITDKSIGSGWGEEYPGQSRRQQD